MPIERVIEDASERRAKKKGKVIPRRKGEKVAEGPAKGVEKKSQR